MSKTSRAAQKQQKHRAAAWRPHVRPVLALWALALLAYSNSFGGGLVFDNRTLIQQDPRIRAATSANLEQIWSQDYWGGQAASGLWRPLTTFSYLCNYAILGNGTNPAGYHWINFLLHAVNIALLYWLAWLLLEETGLAFATAAVWAVHPVLTEAVTNIVGRADLLAAIAVLGGLLCHVKAGGATGRPKTVWLLALTALVTLGLFSKESAVVVFLAMAIYDITFRAASWRSLVPSYAVPALPLAVFLYLHGQVMAKLPALHFPYGDNPLLGADFSTSRLTAIKVIGKYLWLLVWPLRLSCDYSYNQIPLVTWRFNNQEDWKAIIALVICVAAAAVAIFCYRRNKPAFFFIAFFFAALAPTANIAMLLGTIMAERFLYLPAIGFAGCLVLAIHAAGRRWSRNIVPAVVGCVCLLFAVRTFARNLDWTDGRSLWSSAVTAAPDSFKTHASLANPSLYTSPNLDLTLREIDRALAILDPLPDARNAAPVYADAGGYYRQRGDLRKSLDLLLRARRIDLATNGDNRPGTYRVYLELGRTYAALSETDKAMEAFDTGLRLRMAPEFFHELSGVYAARGEPRQAVAALIEGLVVDPASPQLAAELTGLYRKTDPQSCAIGNSGTLNMACPLVHADICTASRNVIRRYTANHQPSAAASTRRSAMADLGCSADALQ